MRIKQLSVAIDFVTKRLDQNCPPHGIQRQLECGLLAIAGNPLVFLSGEVEKVTGFIAFCAREAEKVSAVDRQACFCMPASSNAPTRHPVQLLATPLNWLKLCTMSACFSITPEKFAIIRKRRHLLRHRHKASLIATEVMTGVVVRDMCRNHVTGNKLNINPDADTNAIDSFPIGRGLQLDSSLMVW